MSIGFLSDLLFNICKLASSFDSMDVWEDELEGTDKTRSSIFRNEGSTWSGYLGVFQQDICPVTREVHNTSAKDQEDTGTDVMTSDGESNVIDPNAAIDDTITMAPSLYDR